MRTTAAASQGSNHSLESPEEVATGFADGGGLVAVWGAAAKGLGAAGVVRLGVGAGIELATGGCMTAGALVEGTARLTCRSADGWRDVFVAGCVVVVAAGGAAAGGTVAAGVSSAGRVLVPGRLKFCNSRGPTASVAGVVVLVVAGAGCAVFWASAAAGRSIATAANVHFKRKPALINPLCLGFAVI